MVIGVVHASLSIPESRSLKDKRSVIRSVKDRLRNELNVSVGEVGKQDLWKSAELAVVTVAATTEIVNKRISRISDFLHANPRYVLLDLHTELL